MSEETVELEDVSVEAETDLALLCNIDDKKHWIPKASSMKTRKFRVRATPEQSCFSDGLPGKKGCLIAMCNGAHVAQALILFAC